MIILGILGFLEGSWISLAAGGGSGVLILLGAWLSSKKPKPAFIGLLVLSILLTGRFLPLYLASAVIYPSGIIAALTIAGIIVAGLTLFSKSKASKA